MRPVAGSGRAALRSRGMAAVAGGVLLAMLWPASASPATGVVVKQVRTWTAPDHTRIVLDVSGPASYEVRRVSDPERIAVNVSGGTFAATSTLPVEDGVVLRIRRNALRGRAQLVIDLAGAFSWRDFPLTAAAGRPYRIVVDIFRPGGSGGPVALAPAAEAGQEPATPVPAPEAVPAPESVPVGAPADLAQSGAEEERRGRPFVIVIDPGHGGMDPGAIRGGVQEKDVVLEVARELARLVNELPACRAVLTRRGDYFVTLAERVRIAQRERGDLFLSLHCNTHPRTATDGMEVYFLSLQGATDREAQELADKENAADLVGLAPDDARDDSVLSILMDLRMARVLDQSSRLAECLLSAARGSAAVAARKVKQARFQVLRSLAMPSALVEMAYLSNDGDRRFLGATAGRRRLAALLLDGVRAWRGDGAAPVATVMVARDDDAWSGLYRVRRGDTLWDLARRHETTIAEICRRNGLRSREIRVGQRLHLPLAD